MAGPEQTLEEKLGSIGRVLDADPSLNKWATLLKEYAIAKGGLTLQFWQLHLGAVFRDPKVHPDPRRVDDVAAILKVPVSTLVKILGETHDAIHAEWENSPEHQEEIRVHEARRRASDEAKRAGRLREAQ